MTDYARDNKRGENAAAPNCFKVIVAGEKGCGKSSFFNRVSQGIFEDNYNPTIAAGFAKVLYQYNGREVYLYLWDTSGEEKFQATTKMYYKDTNLALLMFDISNKESFVKVPLWLDYICDNVPEEALIYLIAAKTDLEEDVSMKEVDNFIAKKNSGPKIVIHKKAYISSKTGDGIEELLNAAVYNLLDEEKKRDELGQVPKRVSYKIVPEKKKVAKKGCNC